MEMLPRLREQVELLTAAMAPLEAYLSPAGAGDGVAGFLLQQRQDAAGGGRAADEA
jgi:hypothetical protein